MAQKRKNKFEDSLANLELALKFYDKTKGEDVTAFLAVSKAFEVAVEYSWKELKKRVEDEGLEAQSPKEAVRGAAQIGVINDANLWLDFINARNMSVHDYFGMKESEYVKLAKMFLKSAKSL